MQLPCRHLPSCILLAFLTLGCVQPSGATSRSVPGEAPTIGSALSASTAGDSVVVDSGTYAPSTNGETFPLTIPADVILLGAGRDDCIVDAEGSASVLWFDGGAPIVRGFRFRGGSADRGGGAQILSGSPEISDCLFLQNQALRRGAGINIQGTAAPWIHHNVVWESFDSNITHPGDPHGIQFGESSTGLAEHNLIGRGDSNGLLVGEFAAPVIRHNIFFENGIDGVRGRGICNLGDPTTVVSHNLFFGNSIAAMVIPNPAGGFLDLSGSAASSLDAGDPIYGNIDGDPRLVSPGLLIFQLFGDSPAIDAGDPSLAGDPDGSVADLGPYYYPIAVGETPDSPGLTRLLPSFPNPFNPRTQLRFELARSADVELEVLDLRGRRVRSLGGGALPMGVHSLVWDGTNDRGETVASGVYIVHLATSTFDDSQVVTLIR